MYYVGRSSTDAHQQGPRKAPAIAFDLHSTHRLTLTDYEPQLWSPAAHITLPQWSPAARSALQQSSPAAHISPAARATKNQWSPAALSVSQLWSPAIGQQCSHIQYSPAARSERLSPAASDVNKQERDGLSAGSSLHAAGWGPRCCSQSGDSVSSVIDIVFDDRKQYGFYPQSSACCPGQTLFNSEH